MSHTPPGIPTPSPNPGASSGNSVNRTYLLVAIGLFVVLLALGGSYLYYFGGGTKVLDTSEQTSVDAPPVTQRKLSSATIESVVPVEGKFIVADLAEMNLFLYENGEIVQEFPILTKGKVGSPFETPTGLYKVRTKEEKHLSTISNVYLPYSMQFYGNYFIHGWPYYPDGTPVASPYSGGCIRLSTKDSETVFRFAEHGTGLFVIEATDRDEDIAVTRVNVPLPKVSSQSYLVADIDTGEVYLEKDAASVRPIASITKLMTALVANETISYLRNIPISSGNLQYPQVATDTDMESVVIGKLFYPLLMESNNEVAHTISRYYGQESFIGWMNSTAKSLNMHSTRFADSSGQSPENVSTADDLYWLAVYLSNKKPFALKISSTPTYTLETADGTEYPVQNFNVFYNNPSFTGGKVGQTAAAGETMLSVFKDQENRIAIIVLQSEDSAKDTAALLGWYRETVPLP